MCFKTGLTCSAGIGRNRLVAKLAADFKKPDGQTFVPSEEVIPKVRKMKVTEIPGIGPKYEFILREAFEIRTIQELYEKRGLLPLHFLEPTLKLFASAMMGTEKNIRENCLKLDGLLKLEKMPLCLGFSLPCYKCYTSFNRIKKMIFLNFL